MIVINDAFFTIIRNFGIGNSNLRIKMELIIPRCFSVPKQSYFLSGPRGTGKSTLLKSVYPEAYYIDMLKPEKQRMYQARPERIIELVHANPSVPTFIVDEIQKVPELLGAIHSLIEEKVNKKFVLTGSSSRKLKSSGVNLLAGRILYRQLHPFLFFELGDRADLNNALNYGLVPLIHFAKDPKDTLDAYVSLYIREEVQYESLVRNMGNFSRFLEAISFSHGSVLNISNVARECGIERKLVENYISVLEDILLASRLEIFTKRAKRALSAHPKFYFFDAGVFRNLRPQGPLDKPEETDGAALEGLVFQHLKAWNSYGKNTFKIYFWRSRSGVEVDFILYGQQGIYAFEVKNTGKIRSEDLRPLAEFKKDYPECRTVFLYRGTDKLMRNNALCLPCGEFLSSLNPELSMEEVLETQ